MKPTIEHRFQHDDPPILIRAMLVEGGLDATLIADAGSHRSLAANARSCSVWILCNQLEDFAGGKSDCHGAHHIRHHPEVVQNFRGNSSVDAKPMRTGAVAQGDDLDAAPRLRIGNAALDVDHESLETLIARLRQADQGIAAAKRQPAGEAGQKATGSKACLSLSTKPSSPVPELSSHSRSLKRRGECGIDSPSHDLAGRDIDDNAAVRRCGRASRRSYRTGSRR